MEWEFLSPCYKNLLRDPFLSQFNLGHSPISYLSKLYFVIILYNTPKFSYWSLFFRFSTKIIHAFIVFWETKTDEDRKARNGLYILLLLLLLLLLVEVVLMRAAPTTYFWLILLDLSL